MCLIVENNGNVAPKCWTSHPDIDGDIENSSAQNHDQLALLIRILEVKPPQSILSGYRKVVLNEVMMEASFTILCNMKGFEKVSAGVSKYCRFENHYAL